MNYEDAMAAVAKERGCDPDVLSVCGEAGVASCGGESNCARVRELMAQFEQPELVELPSGDVVAAQSPLLRQFESGATRSADAGRYDPDGFLSPLVIERYCEYMNKHRIQADGSVRGSDNWQKGLPLAVYAKGGWRHFLHFWTRHRGWNVSDSAAAASIEEDICALLFNLNGYLHELLAQQQKQQNS